MLEDELAEAMRHGMFFIYFYIYLNPINHLLGSLYYWCTNTRLSEQNPKIFASMNSAFYVVAKRFAVA